MDQTSDKRKKSLLDQAVKTAGQAGEIAREVAGLARKVAGQASAGLSDTAGAALISQAGDGALKLAQTYLRKGSLTLPLPAPLLSHQISQRLNGRGGIDHLSLSCGDDLLHIKVDGHIQRFIYTVELHFAVIECQVTPESRHMLLQQTHETLDVQLRQTPVVVNWALRQASRQAFKVVNKLPLPLVQQIIREIPGIHAEGHKRWRIDLTEAGLIDIIENPGWMLDKLAEMTDFNLLPGLNVLSSSRELLQRLVDQFEVRGLRVQPGRLDVKVGIGKP